MASSLYLLRISASSLPLVNDWWDQNALTPMGMAVGIMGTAAFYSAAEETGWLPVKNLTTAVFEDHPKFNGDYIRANYKMKPRPCYACRLAHCHDIELASGPHKGKVVEEPEYEDLAAFSSQIGASDPDAAIWLTNVNDRLGMDAKEQAFVLGLAMECYEKEVITKKDTDGLDLTWGNVEAVEVLLHKIAKRDGFGDVLAEGVMRAAEKIGGDAPKFAVYTHKGNAPHVHDPRGLWGIMLGQSVSDMGSFGYGMGDVGDILPDTGLGLLDAAMAFSEQIPKDQAILSRRGQFVDCIGVCMFVAGPKLETIADTVGAVTGWDFTWREAADVGERVMNIMRAFNIRHGHTREHDCVSPRLLEAPIDGPAKGVSIGPKYDKLVDDYYEAMGWNKAGKPLPETLKKVGLESVVEDIW